MLGVLRLPMARRRYDRKGVGAWCRRITGLPCVRVRIPLVCRRVVFLSIARHYGKVAVAGLLGSRLVQRNCGTSSGNGRAFRGFAVRKNGGLRENQLGGLELQLADALGFWLDVLGFQ